jgi:NADPH-dependent 7-cyano-7-deazaguanine reductase QueF
MSKLTIDNPYNLDEVTFNPTVSAICVEGDAPFQGQAQISYVPNDKLLEFEAFESWLKEISQTHTTIEGLAAIIMDKLVEVLGEQTPIRIYIHAETQVHAPASVTIIHEGS